MMMQFIIYKVYRLKSGLGPLSCQVGDIQTRQQVMLSRLASRRSISLKDEMHRIGENALYAKACSTLRETYQNTVLKITHHSSISTFNQTFLKLIMKYKMYASYFKKNIKNSFKYKPSFKKHLSLYIFKISHEI